MNFINAIHSNLPVRRKGRSSWPRKACHGEHSSVIICDPKKDHWLEPCHLLEVCILEPEDILADDWEVRTHQAILITFPEFWDAAELAIDAFGRTSQGRPSREFLNIFARRLGLIPIRPSP